MKGKVSINKDKETEIRKALKENGGYCPCATEKTNDTKCMCKAFQEQDFTGDCHCGLYHKVVKGSSTIVLLHDIGDTPNSTTINETRENTMKVKLTLPDAKAPERANPADAGADLFSPITVSIAPKVNQFIDFGVAIELPEGSVGLIFARSGLGSKYGIVPRNAVGVIDEKYRGNLGMMVKNDSNDLYTIKAGDRIAQLVVVPVLTPEIEVVDELNMEGDREGGFGSTGK